MRFFLLFIVFASLLFSANIELIKQENSDSNTTLLVIGGIHGNEPGGYFAASILATHYTIKSKNLWVIPKLNEESIIHDRRGINGDMNRKFSKISDGDKDKKIIEELKKIILDPKVSLVLNLHDGHGFYRKDYLGSIFNPNAWGQTCVIDQCQLNEDLPFCKLGTIANTVKEKINQVLLEKHHEFTVKNTKTKFDDEQMQLSLTYFAVTHNKPAFAIETSKNLYCTGQKVFYQLVALEEYMKIMGIKFSRDFELTTEEIKKIIDDYGILTINDNFLINLNNIKNTLRFIPIKSKNNEFHFTSPLGVVRKSEGFFKVYIGNKLITKLKPQYFEACTQSLENIKVEVDGKMLLVKNATSFSVKEKFKLITEQGYRVNVIGFSSKGTTDESGLEVTKSDLDKLYSLDKAGNKYRIEIYKDKQFCSMIMVHFK